jgi:hypothetical protein
MKFALMAGIAALAFSGVAQAGDVIISETLTGHITGGFDSGLHGSNDWAFLFGGLNLYNDAVSVTFSYDATTLAAIGFDDYYPIGYSYIGANAPAPYSISVTIGGATDTIVPTYDNETELCSDNPTYCGGENLFFTIGESLPYYDWVQLYVYNRDAPISLFNVNSQSDITQFLSNPADTYEIWAYNNFGSGTDILTASLTLGSPTPEPTTSILLAMGLGGVAFLKFRYSTGSR